MRRGHKGGVLAGVASLFSAYAMAAGSEAALRDIRGTVPIDAAPVPFLATGGVVLVCGLLVLLWRVHRRRVAPPPPVPADRAEQALEDLADLIAAFRRADYAADRLLLRLDILLRAELARRAGIAANRLTSAELPVRLAASAGEAAAPQLAELLLLFDQVKFAAYRPNGHEVEQALATVAGLLARLHEANPA
jgi:hypothetical protein